MLRNSFLEFLESKFAHIKPTKVPNFCKHIMLAPAGINCKQRIDTEGFPQITSIKEPPQNPHLAESCLGYTAEGEEHVLRGLSGERMGMSLLHHQM